MENEMIEIGGISFNRKQMVSMEQLNSLFDCIFDDDERSMWVSKQVYEHEEEGFNFKYRYAIESECCEGDMYYALQFVPDFGSLNKKTQESISHGGDEENEPMDCIFYGCYIDMVSDSVEGTEETDYEKIRALASVVRTVDGMRGFFLDRYVNRIGDTGWDYLKGWIEEK